MATEVGEIQNLGECKLCWFCSKFSLDPGEEETPAYFLWETVKMLCSDLNEASEVSDEGFT